LKYWHYGGGEPALAKDLNLLDTPRSKSNDQVTQDFSHSPSDTFRTSSRHRLAITINFALYILLLLSSDFLSTSSCGHYKALLPQSKFYAQHENHSSTRGEMGVPYSHEIQKASDHIDAIMPTVKIALWILNFVSISLLILIGALFLAVIALLITVNPDLERERKALVTPVLRGWLTVPRLLVGASPAAAAPRGEFERSERTAPPSEKRTATANEEEVHF
jgi:hypothetical protein